MIPITMPDPQQDKTVRLGRRAFLKGGALLLAGSTLGCGKWPSAAADENTKPKLRIGLVTDLHYADKDPWETRYFQESLTKLAEAAKRFDQEKPDLVVCLGDLIDSAPSLDAEKKTLAQVAKKFAPLPGKHHFVVGNHCVENLTKPEFLGIVGQEKSYYSFDAAGYHFVVLDACFNSNGAPYGRKNFKWADAKLPPAELEWLRADLRRSPLKSIVFVHQCLDVAPPFGVQNGPEVRKILEDSGKVLAVLQGHFHWGNYQELGGLHYCTLSAVIEGSGAENNAYATMDILPGDVIRITGFRKQKNYRWS
jgi:alkaline phosphatase